MILVSVFWHEKAGCRAHAIGSADGFVMNLRIDPCPCFFALAMSMYSGAQPVG